MYSKSVNDHFRAIFDTYSTPETLDQSSSLLTGLVLYPRICVTYTSVYSLWEYVVSVILTGVCLFPFHRNRTPTRVAVSNTMAEPGKPLCYSSSFCFGTVDLEVGKPKAREVDLLVRKLYKAEWKFYITELLNLRTLRHALESRWDAEPGPVTKITLPSSQLEPGTPHRVRVRPAENLKEAPIWIDEATFKTPGRYIIDDVW